MVVEENVDIKVIRSQRKTISMALKPEGLVVRAPIQMSNRQIQQFIDAHRDWIRKAVARQEQRQRELEQRGASPITKEEVHQLKEMALAYIPERVRYYAPKVGVTYGEIRIKQLKSRWGSCSAKGNLNFNCLLMLAPLEVIDSVVVHELCHRKEMNHSERFYREVLRVIPDYWKHHRWLKEYGTGIMSRVTE